MHRRRRYVCERLERLDATQRGCNGCARRACWRRADPARARRPHARPRGWPASPSARPPFHSDRRASRRRLRGRFGAVPRARAARARVEAERGRARRRHGLGRAFHAASGSRRDNAGDGSLRAPLASPFPSGSRTRAACRGGVRLARDGRRNALRVPGRARYRSLGGRELVGRPRRGEVGDGRRGVARGDQSRGRTARSLVMIRRPAIAPLLYGILLVGMAAGQLASFDAFREALGGYDVFGDAASTALVVVAVEVTGALGLLTSAFVPRLIARAAGVAGLGVAGFW